MKNKHIVRIIIFYVLMFASSFGGTIEELLRHDYDYNYAMGYGFLITVLDILIVSLSMMILPFMCKIIKKKLLPYKAGKRVCLWNSIVLFILSCVLMIIFEIGFIGGIGALFFYFINKWLFVEPPLLSQEEIENLTTENKIDTVDNIEQTPDLDIDKMSPQEAAEYLVAEQLGEKYIPKEKQDKKIKIKYCSQCGSQTDPVTKKCTGCGKQYFRGLRFTKFSITVIALASVIAIVSTLGILQYVNTQELKAEISGLENQVKNKQSTIDSLQSQVKNKQSTIDSLQSQVWDNEELVDFVDNHVVFVEDDGTNYYHKYECYRFISYSFWVFNIEAARGRGYKACPYCH